MAVAKRIIPCLDVAEGRVVKGVNFLNLRDAGDPVQVALNYDQQGADELALLDITASHEQRDTIVETVRQVAEQLFIPLTVGGGVRNLEDIDRLLRAGADKVSINTAAVQNPDYVSQAASRFGSQCIVVAIDARRENDSDSRWQVFTHGGRHPTGIDVLPWAQEMVVRGAGEILLTSMDRDGTGDGFDLALTRAVSDAVSVPIIASGGVGSLQHLADGLTEGRADAVLAATIFHYGSHTIPEAKQFLARQGLTMRGLD